MKIIDWFFRDNPSIQGQRLWFEAQRRLGTEVSTTNLAPEEFGCAETISDLIIDARFFDMPIMISTIALRDFFNKSSAWVKVGTPLPGDVIISATLGAVHGHTGMIMSNNKDGVVIASNDSRSGLFDENYTLQSWIRRYQNLLGLQVEYFRRIKN